MQLTTKIWSVISILLGVMMLHEPLGSQESILLNPDEQAPLYPSSSVLPISSDYINPTPVQVITPKPEKKIALPIVVPKTKAVPVIIVKKRVERVTLDFRNADIKNALQFIGDVSGFNMVVGDAVVGSLTIHLSDVNWLEALNAILQVKNLGYTESDGIYRILPFEESGPNAKICH